MAIEDKSSIFYPYFLLPTLSFLGKKVFLNLNISVSD